MTSTEVLRLIDAGYTKAEIDALINDVDINATSESDNSDSNNNSESTNVDTNVSNKNDTDNVSNAAILAALNMLNKNMQEFNRNHTTDDTNTNIGESTTNIMAKMFR